MNDGGINAVEIHAGKLRLDLAAFNRTEDDLTSLSIYLDS
jgi:hypothetical protein